MTILSFLLVFVLLWYIIAISGDVIYDLIYLVKRKQLKPKSIVPSGIKWDEAQRIAIMIPAYQEAGVVGEMIKSTLKLASYPISRLEFFVGVYPNDQATRQEVAALAEQYPNVHCVVNSKAGPTNKSQNLNQVYRFIEDFESKKGRKFAAIAVHDAEDVIHPYTFRLYNTLLKQHAVVQLPVFALFPKGNWFQQLVAGTYADEFAEHHLHHMPVREHLGKFVPSAGTGFALRRNVAERLAAEGPLFREGALTEDYELATRLWKLGAKVHFHVQQVERIDDKGHIKKEYIAVREYFPKDFMAAIKQKSRWIYGITMQAPSLIDHRKLNLKDRLTLLEDQKGKFTNLVHIIGYPLTIYALLSLIFPLPFSISPLAYILGLVVITLTFGRLLMRFFAVKAIYGWREGILASFAPPLLPVRWIIGNVINLMATIRAWRLYFWPNGFQQKSTPTKAGTAPSWDKTERNSYVSEDILQDTQRRLGDNLLFYSELNHRHLSRMIQLQQKSKRRLGELLTAEQLLDERRLNKRLAELLHVKPSSLSDQNPNPQEPTQ